MVSFSSLFSWPFDLPSLPSISLPANIQRRFLSYVLKRALGRFVKTGGLDVDRIQAQISEGWVEIQGLEVDAEAINALLPPTLGLTLTGGRIDNITAQVPFSNLWSDPLSVILDDLTLDFDLADPHPSSRASPRTSTSHHPSPSSPHIDLAQSVTTAADDFLHEELDAFEEAELGNSIRQSLVLSQNDPFSSGDIPGGFPFAADSAGGPSAPVAPTTESKTALAGLVERILARLQVKVRNVRVRVRFVDKHHGATFELRIGEIQYSDESDSDDSGAGKIVRALRLSSVAIYTVPSRPPPPSFSRPPYTTSTRSSSSSSTSSYTDGQADMTMSLAVADLRQSTMSSIASGASIYHSALEEGEEEDDEAEGMEENRARSATPTAAPSEPDVLLLSFGNEGIVLRMTTSPPNTRPPAKPDLSLAASERPSMRRASTNQVVDVLPLMEVEVILGTVSAVLLPRQIASILAATQVAAPKSTTEAPTTHLDGVQPRIEGSVRIRGFNLALVHDMDALPLSFGPALEQFWVKPSSTYLPVGHLKLRMEGLSASYSSKGYIPSSAPPVRRSTSSTFSIHRRPSSSVHFGPRPPSVELKVSEVSIFEYLATDSATSETEPLDAIPGGAYPVLIFDSNLLKQYDLRTSSSTRPSSGLIPPPLFPEYDSVDWRNSGLQRRSGTGEKAWKVRSGVRGVLKGVSQPTGQEEGPAISIKAQIPSSPSSSTSSPASIHLQPVHLFLDLSLLERLLPLLRFIAPAIRTLPPERDAYADIANSRRYNPTPTAPRGGQYVIDDLDAQAASVSTLRAQPQRSTLLEVTCPLVRVDIRCPAPINRRGTWGDGAHLRSGIVTLDLHQLAARIGAGAVGTGGKAGAGDLKVEWEKMLFFFCRVPDKRAQAFLVVGPLAPDAADPPDMTPLLPSVTIGKTTNHSKFTSTSLVTCRIPSVQAKIRQSTIEGLQFFADDITHWLDGAFGDGSAPKPRDDLKMIGSRFFGSKGSSSASSSAEEEEDDAMSATILKVIVSEIDIALHVPRRQRGEAPASERVLSLQASDVDVKVESNTAGKQETTLAVAIMDAEFSDRTNPATPIRILGRTTPLTLTMHNSPLASIRFSSLADPVAQTKETGNKVILATLAVFITKDLAWVTELAKFAKTPEGVFEDMTPAEVTRIALQLFDCSVHVSAPTLPGGVAAVFGALDVKTDIISDAEQSVVDLSLTGGNILAIDDMAAASALPVGHSSSTEAWKRAGYAPMIELDPVEIQLFRELVAPKQIVLDVLKSHVRVTACADSLGTFASLVGDLPHLVPSKSKVNEPPVKSPTELDQSINVFGSIDEDTFRRLPDPISGMDLMEDDLPNNLDYLDSTARRVKQDSADTTEGLRSWQTEYDDHLGGHHLSAEINGETIMILVKEVFDFQEDYWENLPVLEGDLSDKLGPVRVRFHDVTTEVLLYDGFDWLRTRKAIEEEIRAVRRRLERIKQLLASGQKADDSVERGSSMLFNSVYIGLDQSKEGMDTAALLAAIDDELEGLGEETASQSSWQTMPAVGADRPSTKKTRLRGKRITRSKKAQIEIALTGVKADVDLFGPKDEISGRIQITARSLEILDHIKTSTWKKFLSEMRADSRGNIRETGADMLRLELTSVRPSLPHPGEELRLKAKILPLRLHIDQDALDFLKRFFSFQMPPNTPSADAPIPVDTPVPTKGKELFFQHVEIFPIEIKLDYKPKRVDFAALREGKTIELMNFFHFDGAEMTLRHITMSGVSGLARLSTMLQDIWTPDVKSNQLADVISGVSPIRSMVNVGSGVADLFLLPIEQYRKDGRVARGVQRGTSSFVRSTAMEMMKLGAKLATGTQVVLERAEGALGGGSRAREESSGGTGSAAVRAEATDSEDEGEIVDVVSRYANQPTDAREGVQAAYKSLSTNINTAAQTILAVPMEVYERSGDNGPLKAVARAVPSAVLRPMIGASEAVSKTLLGVRNSLDPTSREELGDKYK